VTRTFREIQLGEEARNYMSSSLAVGKELSASLLRTVTFSTGVLSTSLPVEVTWEEANQFRVGGKLRSPRNGVHMTSADGTGKAVPIPNLDDLIVSVVETHLRLERRAYCVFEDAIARPGDPWLERTHLALMMSREAVYYLLTSEDANRERIEATVRRAKSISPPLIGALAFLPVDEQLPRADRALTDRDFSSIATQTESVIVGAYDGEGFVIWSRH
jgi:hypothetical protein